MKKLIFLTATILVAMAVLPATTYATTPPTDVVTDSENPNPDFPLSAEQIDRWALLAKAEAERRFPNDNDVGTLLRWSCTWNQKGKVVCENAFDLPPDYCWYGYIFITAEYRFFGEDHYEFVDLKKEWRESLDD